MAENKKTFIFYSDWANMIKEMPNEDAGQLIKHILSYVNDEDPISENILVKMAFGHMKPLLKADLDKWEKQLEKYSKMGKASAKSRSKKKVEPRLTQVEPTSTVNDNVNVNVNVNESKKEIDDIYNLYPSKCVVKGSSTGKSENNKDQIKKLLKSKGVKEISNIINRYITECKNDQIFMKNFKTFLNNIPDYDSEKNSVQKLVVAAPKKGHYVK